MARYYLHLRNSTDEVLDHEGTELPDVQAVRKAVLASARDLIAHDIKHKGFLDCRYRIDAENVNGEIVHSLAFKRAVKIISESNAPDAANDHERR